MRDFYDAPRDDHGYPVDFNHEALCEGGPDCGTCYPDNQPPLDVHMAPPAGAQAYRDMMGGTSVPLRETLGPALDRLHRELRWMALRSFAKALALWGVTLALLTLGVWFGWNRGIAPLADWPRWSMDQAAGVVAFAVCVSVTLRLFRRG